MLAPLGGSQEGARHFAHHFPGRSSIFIPEELPMKEAQVYLIFNGNCGEAMAFYGKALGAQVEIQTYEAAPIPAEFKVKGRVIHARLQKGPTVVMASDSRVDQP